MKGKNTPVIIILVVALVCVLVLIGVILVKNTGLLPSFGSNAELPDVIPVLARGNDVDTQLDTVAESLTKTEYKLSVKDKYKIIHDFVAYWLEYDYDKAGEAQFHRYYELVGDNDYLDAFENQIALSGGYATLFKEMCDRAGLQCKVIVGTAEVDGERGVDHAWNLVSYDGAWYHVDVCIDDMRSKNGNLNYDWFLQGNSYATNYFRTTDDPAEIEDKSIIMTRSKMETYKFDVTFEFVK